MMPTVGNKKYAYTKKGKAAAKKARSKARSDAKIPLEHRENYTKVHGIWVYKDKNDSIKAKKKKRSYSPSNDSIKAKKKKRSYSASISPAKLKDIKKHGLFKKRRAKKKRPNRTGG